MMILLTIGTHEPFDRLVQAMDRIAASLFNVSVVAQIPSSCYNVKNMKTLSFISPLEFDKLLNDASLIVSHAGMGTIISALQKGKPIVVMPRTAALGETRNDHQLATARNYEALNYLHVANTEFDLSNKIEMFLKGDLKPLHQTGKYASNELIFALRKELQQKENTSFFTFKNN
jgi:UDP-N-acetylglucosamine transferase subunit ALG13